MRNRRTIALALLALAYLLLLGARVEYLRYVEAQETLPRYIGVQALVVGRVAAEPDRRDTSLHLTITVVTVNNEPASGTLLAIAPPDANARYNDTVAAKGTITAPQSFITDTGHTFDYASYLRVRGISATIARATMVSDTPGNWSLLGTLFSLKQSFERSLEKIFPQPDNALLQGILLGERRGIPQDLTNAFVGSGLIHIVVLSGYNISIVSEAVFRALGFLPATLRYGTGGVTMLLFALMVGNGSTTVRALIMALIALLARYLHRNVLAMRSLIAAAAVMALWNPRVLLFDPSFILSVLATFGLITLAPAVEAHLPRFLMRFPQTKSIIASTTAVQLFVLPALLYFTGVLSLTAVPANALVLPMVPLAMLAGFVAGCLGFIAPILALVPALLSDVILRWILFVAQTAAAIPLGTLIIPQFSGWIVAALYVPLTAAVLFVYKNSAK